MKPPARKRVLLGGAIVLSLITFFVFAVNWRDSIFRKSQQTIELEGRGTPPAIMSIAVPESATYSRTDGIDYIVHKITFPDQAGTIGIYVGGNPNRFLDDPKISEAGTIGDHAIEWATGTVDSVAVAETVIPMFLNPGPSDRGSFVIDQDSIHLWATSPEEKNLRSLMESCETLTLIKPRTLNR